MIDLKEKRKLAKFYGGKALVGTSAKQKAWAEDIRKQYLESALSDEIKTELIKLGGDTQKARFWILNRDNLKNLTKENLIKEDQALREVLEKHSDTLSRTCSVAEKEKARLEIYQQLKNAKINIGWSYPIPNFDPFNEWGELLEMKQVNGRLVAIKKRRKWRT